MALYYEMIEDYLKFASRLVDNVISRYSLQLVKHDKSGMGEWYVNFENSEFIVSVWRERSGYVGIDLGSKIQSRPRAHIRGPWPMSHLKGYLDGNKDHYNFASIDEEASWFENNEKQLFDSSLLNSDNLNQWAAKASRRLFGQDSKK